MSPSESSESLGVVKQGAVKLKIATPSDGELTIAPGCSFKVSGSLSGEIPDDAKLKVALLDAFGRDEALSVAG